MFKLMPEIPTLYLLLLLSVSLTVSLLYFVGVIGETAAFTSPYLPSLTSLAQVSSTLSTRAEVFSGPERSLAIAEGVAEYL